MSHFPKYPPIPLLARRQDILAVKTVVCTEKLHGSTFRLLFPMGMTSIEEVGYGSHEMDYEPGKPFPIMHAVRWFQERPELLNAMWEVIKSYDFPDATIFGEACGPGSPVKGKLVKYSDGQEILFRAFDIMVGENFLTSYDLFVEVTDKMGLPRVPLCGAGSRAFRRSTLCWSSRPWRRSATGSTTTRTSPRASWPSRSRGSGTRTGTGS